MFCSKCGTKNAKGAKFCKSCGAEMKDVVKDTPKKSAKQPAKAEKKPVDSTKVKDFFKKYKIPIIIGGIIIVLLICYLILNSTVFSAKSFAKKYAQAVIQNDYATQIEYADVYGKSDFITKKIVEEKYKDEKKKNIEQIRMLSDKEIARLNSTGNEDLDDILEDLFDTNTSKSNSLTKTYVFEYITSDSKKSEYLTVNISKASNKKYLVFNNWKALGEDVIAENVTVEADPNTTVAVEGIKLTDKYLDEKNSTKSTNVYKIPSILKEKVSIEIILKNGIKLEDTKNVYSKQSIDTTSSYGYDLTKESTKKLETVVKNFLDGYVTAAINKTDIAEVRKNKMWDEEILEDSTFDSYYESLKTRYESDKIESYEVTEIDVSSSYIDSDGNIQLKAKVKFDYKYKEDSSRSKKTGNDSTSIRLELNSENKDLTILDFNSYGVRYMF